MWPYIGECGLLNTEDKSEIYYSYTTLLSEDHPNNFIQLANWTKTSKGTNVNTFEYSYSKYRSY